MEKPKLTRPKFMDNKTTMFMGIGGILIFALVAFVLLSATATTKAVVPIDDIAAGTTITENIVKEVDVPRSTPGNFYKTISSVLGEKTTVELKSDQLIYASDIMSKIDLSSAENDDYITTSIKVPNDNAVGGMLSAGDVVDISVVPSTGNSPSLARALKGFNVDSSLDGGIYYILSNVTILNATTSMSSDEANSLSNTTASAQEKNSAYYVISVSYNDFKKLRIAEQYGSLWLNLAPTQNENNDPLINDMQAGIQGGLTNAKGTSSSNNDNNSDNSNNN